MKYSTVILASLIMFVFLTSCEALYSYKHEKMFEKHVLDTTENINKIHFFKDRSAIHGPMIFRFTVSKSEEVVRKIIRKHHLKKIIELPKEIIAINHLVSEKVEWWKSLDELREMPIYSVSYVPSSGFGDFHIRCLFVEDNEVYFVTTGFFPADSYIEEKSKSLTGRVP